MPKALTIALLLFLVPGCFAQSPADGHVEGSVYVNSYFRLSYSWPKMLNPVNIATLNLRPPPPGGNEYLLFSAKKGTEPFGVLILAERPSFHRQRSDGLTEGEGFLEHVKKWWDPAGHPVILAQTHFTNANGLTFYELDYIIFGEYSSAITTQIGDFQIVFRCNAQSKSDLEEMTKSVVASSRFK